jgi:hypothetical protein
VSDPGGVLAQAWAVQPMVEAGQVWLPHPEEWPEVEEWLDEMCGYPKAAHDDRVASFTQALQRLQLHIRQGLGKPPDPKQLERSEAAAVAGGDYEHERADDGDDLDVPPLRVSPNAPEPVLRALWPLA